jgi:hypothetical protein
MICSLQESLHSVELIFGYLGKYVVDKSPKYNNASGWTNENLKKFLMEGKDSVTFDMVRSWYCRTFTEMFPDREYSMYLRSELELEIYQVKFSFQILRTFNNFLQV